MNSSSTEEAAIVADLHARRDALRAAIEEKKSVVKNFGKRWILGACLVALPLIWLPAFPFSIVLTVLLIAALILFRKRKARDILLLFIILAWWILVIAEFSAAFEAAISGVVDGLFSDGRTEYKVVINSNNLGDGLVFALPVYAVFIFIFLGPHTAANVRQYFSSSRITFFYGRITSILWIIAALILAIGADEPYSLIGIILPGLVFCILAYKKKTYTLHQIPRIKYLSLIWLAWVFLLGNFIVVSDKIDFLQLVRFWIFLAMTVISAVVAIRMLLYIALALWRKKADLELTRLEIELS